MPPVTILFTAATLIVFIGLNLLEGIDDPEALARWGVLDGTNTWDGGWWTLLTSVFVHADALHLAVNLYWLWALDRHVERCVGSWRFLGLCALSAWVSSAFQLAIAEDPGIGMSGVGYAVFGFAWVARPTFPILRSFVTNRLVALFLVWLVLGFLATAADMGNIGNEAHLSGLACGALLGSATLARWKVPALAGSILLFVASSVATLWAPWSVVWTDLQAWKASQRGDHEDVIRWSNRALALDPEDGWAYSIRGGSRNELGDHARALDDLNRAIELGETDAWTYEERAWAREALGDHEGAAADRESVRMRE